MSKDEVDRLVRDAQSHAADDQRRREVIDVRNEADSLAYQIEKMVNENRERVSPAERSQVESAIQNARKALESDDVQTIRRSIDTLQRASQSFAEAVQRGAQPGRGGAPSGQGGGGQNVAEGEVVDAEPVDSHEQK